jgi:hypothetical protein
MDEQKNERIENPLNRTKEVSVDVVPSVDANRIDNSHWQTKQKARKHELESSTAINTWTIYKMKRIHRLFYQCQC